MTFWGNGCSGEADRILDFHYGKSHIKMLGKKPELLVGISVPFHFTFRQIIGY
jgi:hypothetical protein